MKNVEEKYANACLIAAAPKLLAALEETVKYWETCKIKVPKGLLSQNCAAIAKARGES